MSFTMNPDFSFIALLAASFVVKRTKQYPCDNEKGTQLSRTMIQLKRKKRKIEAHIEMHKANADRKELKPLICHSDLSSYVLL